ncbi:zinc ribbon domain-containing protein [Amycolatopsis magusensis]|uniref:Nucleic acid-binding Zn-ribbon protein n=1 Tax=Amycolatopsis magusensis TaxID=882444 RepID=A0ABS4PPV8_9PSEU|nr:C4-type zinc ribbon domain-containing protein [Amycolatopsis magusensis]MBP2180878.1 putative nucleic acid-binding Zn-ribbon protein [Amycolatopsis magusensis]MDI5980585.1 C4-type zinc ribbon domain-containing protein [Amycolatopsis magusensis]
MKAEPAVQRRLLELAKVDAELSRLAHRRRTLPELAEIAELEQELRAKKDALVSVQTSASDLDREVARQEREIDSVRTRTDKDRKAMASGSVGAKQLTELQHELESLQRRQNALEDDLLELMERREALDLDAQRTGAEVDKVTEQLEHAGRRRDEALKDIDTTQARREQDRTELAPKFPEPLVKLYERVRAQRGIGAALLRSRRCGACHLDLDRSTVSEIKTMPEDEIVQCENCNAILVRTMESGL